MSPAPVSQGALKWDVLIPRVCTSLLGCAHLRGLPLSLGCQGTPFSGDFTHLLGCTHPAGVQPGLWIKVLKRWQGSLVESWGADENSGEVAGVPGGMLRCR